MSYSMYVLLEFPRHHQPDSPALVGVTANARAYGRSYNRPLIFDLLPLVAKTADAHGTVDACLKAARERDEKMTREHAAAMRRLRSTKQKLRSPVKSITAFGSGRSLFGRVPARAAPAPASEPAAPTRQHTSVTSARGATVAGVVREAGAHKRVGSSLTPSASMPHSTSSLPAIGEDVPTRLTKGIPRSGSLPRLAKPTAASSPDLAAFEKEIVRNARLPRIAKPAPPIEQVELTPAERRALTKHSTRIVDGRNGTVASMEPRFRHKFGALPREW